MSDVHVNTPGEALTRDPLSNDTGVIRFLLGVPQYRCVHPTGASAASSPRLVPRRGALSRNRASRIPLLAPMGKTPGFPVRHKSGRSRPFRLRLPRTPQTKGGW